MPQTKIILRGGPLDGTEGTFDCAIEDFHTFTLSNKLALGAGLAEVISGADHRYEQRGFDGERIVYEYRGGEA